MSRADDRPPGRDLPLDADSAALGRRDHGFFDDQHSPRGQRDLAHARTPWTGTRPRRVGAAAAHDRTLGLTRTPSMWPEHTPPATPLTRQDRRRRAAGIVNDLRRLPRPAPVLPTATPTLLLTALHTIARNAHRRPARRQLAAVRRIAADHRLDPDMLLGVAFGVGTLIARATPGNPPGARNGRRDGPTGRLGDGKPSLNALHDANLPLALDTYLARAHLRENAAFSDPDLPRLWMTANALTHGIPAQVILTVPATGRGPDAALHPRRTDLVGWLGIRNALGDLDAAVRTATEGRRWLARAGPARGGSDAVLLALGVLHASHPTIAAELALRGPGVLRLADLRTLAQRLPLPVHLVDLTDTALKAVCDRNGWLLGTPDERHHRELVERVLPTTVTDEIRARLARGDTTALAAALHQAAPTDSDLDARTWRWDPAADDAVQVRQLLAEASREAHARFADWHITPHPSRAVAFLARFPERSLRRALTLDPQRLHILATPPAVVAGQKTASLKPGAGPRTSTSTAPHAESAATPAHLGDGRGDPRPGPPGPVESGGGPPATRAGPDTDPAPGRPAGEPQLPPAELPAWPGPPIPGL
ncbi:hypothetical protein ThrDRAFT_02836 [Frankia casuarinae]|uniref:hypothetical protein n=1 Tax=Frankia casuarinae (strain DSM 45818 / CECT 9043 / HFP020203 / CcI3) TaxID=106370 RepID=UPI0002D9C7FA|nr:hypothetical protein [Frankia casuarinae]EYT91501.1 hypothetical protein ThrDRAFT_02836 [Frankia casuarinae]